MVDVHSRAHRILRPLSLYRDLSEDGELAAIPSLPTFSDPEHALGIYTTEPDFSDATVFTTVGLYIRAGSSWLPLAYSEIERTIPPESKANVSGFYIVCYSGKEVWLPIKGVKDNKFYDAFDILRFLNRVIDDRRKNRGTIKRW